MDRRIRELAGNGCADMQWADTPMVDEAPTKDRRIQRSSAPPEGIKQNSTLVLLCHIHNSSQESTEQKKRGQQQ